ncbi:bucky ball-like isoform X1 [Salvelinus fontinalis]|uniref:bucky ball-like isoform X1 n=1 Tax=Salvelinus fontinalis TaxID=8038 RepID=UPI002486A1F4|nr:bucky ball-like isoform X1 [Salvelinus fontinalis]
MDEGSEHPQSMESDQHNQRQVNHPRPFFYVQPASQPYYNMYQNQWHNMNIPYNHNNPYNHYALPGSGSYPFGRPSSYMSPYPYMQYPGQYIVPHMHPVDYRCMYDPARFYPPPVYDPMFHHQQQQQHDSAQAQSEVACSEAQTQSSDALNKLQTNEKQGSEKELDSGVVSQASGIFSSDNKEGKREVGGDIHSSHGASYGKLESSHLQSSSPLARLFSVSDSTAAVYDGESSRSLGDLGLQEGWAVDSDEEPPLDSSSVHEEDNQDTRHHDEDESLHSCSSENLCLLSAVSQSDDSPRPEDPDNQAEEGSANPDGTSSTEGLLRPQSHCSNLLSPQSLPSPLASDWQALENIKHGEETFAVPDGSLCELDVDPSYQILYLPFDKVFTASALQKDASASSSAALLCEDLQASLSSGQSLATSSTTPVRHHYYCHPQTAHERLSVLCSSLDELSSRDEMFSTDLEDVDVFPGCSVYAGGRFSADLGEAEVKEVCPQSKKLMCVCCGSSLLKGGGVSNRVKVDHSPRVYAAGDSDEVVEQEQRGSVRTCERTHPSRVVVKKHPVHKHQPLPLHIRHAPKHSCKRGQWRGAIGPEEQEPETVLVGSELEYYEGHVVEGKSGHGTGDKQHRTYGLCRDSVNTSDPGTWESGGAKPRQKPHSSLPRQERLAPRKALSKPLVYQRVRDEENNDDDDDEEPQRFQRKGPPREETQGFNITSLMKSKKMSQTKST